MWVSWEVAQCLPLVIHKGGDQQNQKANLHQWILFVYDLCGVSSTLSLMRPHLSATTSLLNLSETVPDWAHISMS